MNDLILYLYLIDIFGNLGSALGFALVSLTAILIAAGITTFIFVASDDFDEIEPFLNKVYKPFIIIFCTLGLLKAIIPSTQTMYTALGLYTANQVMQQPQMVEVGNQAMRILQAKLDEYEKELTQEKPNEP